jgi:hypothetical protein
LPEPIELAPNPKIKSFSDVVFFTNTGNLPPLAQAQADRDAFAKNEKVLSYQDITKKPQAQGIKHKDCLRVIVASKEFRDHFYVTKRV